MPHSVEQTCRAEKKSWACSQKTLVLVLRHYSGGGSSCVEWTAHIRLHHPLFVLQVTISPVRFSTQKYFFSLKVHSRVHLFKDDVASGKLDVTSLWRRVGSCFRQCVTRAFLDAVVAWRWVMVTITASRAWAVSLLRWRSWMSHLLIVDAHLGVVSRLRYLDKGAELLPTSRSSSRPGCRQARSTSGGSMSGLRITVVANPQGTITPLAQATSWAANGTCYICLALLPTIRCQSLHRRVSRSFWRGRFGCAAGAGGAVSCECKCVLIPSPPGRANHASSSGPVGTRLVSPARLMWPGEMLPPPYTTALLQVIQAKSTEGHARGWSRSGSSERAPYRSWPCARSDEDYDTVSGSCNVHTCGPGVPPLAVSGWHRVHDFTYIY